MKNKDYEDYLNVFKMSHIPFHRRIKFAWQRATRGFCDHDWWDLDNFYCNLMAHSLRHYASKTSGYSPSVAPTFEEYKERVLKLADCFEELARREENDGYPEDGSDEEKRQWFKDRNEAFTRKTKEAFKELNEVFWSLWD